MEFVTEGSLLDIKPVVCIQMELNSCGSARRISVSLKSRNSQWDNYYVVAGSDCDWVHRVFSEVADVVSSARPQNVFIGWFSWVLTLPCTLGIAWLLYVIIVYIGTMALYVLGDHGTGLSACMSRAALLAFS
jgi:hypothetical protein